MCVNVPKIALIHDSPRFHLKRGMCRHGCLAPAGRAVWLACRSCSVITVITASVAAAAAAVTASITAAAVIAAVTTAAFTIILVVIIFRPEGRQHGGEMLGVGYAEAVLVRVGLLQVLQERAESLVVGDLGHLRLKLLAVGQLKPRCWLGSVRAAATSASCLRPLPLRRWRLSGGLNRRRRRSNLLG
jgi:hypothetical protein